LLLTRVGMNKLRKLTLLLVLMSIAPACLANGVGSGRYAKAPGRGDASGESSTSSASTLVESCGGDTIDVLPDVKGSLEPGEFQACKDAGNSDQVWLGGTVYDSAQSTYGGGEETQQVCLFPMYSVSFTNGNPTSRVFTPDEYGFPMYSCATLDQDRYGNFEAIRFEFDNVEFDGVLVVKLQDLHQMRSCLYLERESICPDYAEGSF
jgi:hypothetical protein